MDINYDSQGFGILLWYIDIDIVDGCGPMLALGLIREVKYNWDRSLKSSVHFRARTVNVDPQIVFKRFKRNELKIVEGIVFWQDEKCKESII